MMICLGTCDRLLQLVHVGLADEPSRFGSIFDRAKLGLGSSKVVSSTSRAGLSSDDAGLGSACGLALGSSR